MHFHNSLNAKLPRLFFSIEVSRSSCFHGQIFPHNTHTLFSFFIFQGKENKELSAYTLMIFHTSNFLPTVVALHKKYHLTLLSSCLKGSVLFIFVIMNYPVKQYERMRDHDLKIVNAFATIPLVLCHSLIINFSKGFALRIEQNGKPITIVNTYYNIIYLTAFLLKD